MSEPEVEAWVPPEFDLDEDVGDMAAEGILDLQAYLALHAEFLDRYGP